MLLTTDDKLMAIHSLFAVLHFFYFVIYYGRYSTLNQKLNGIAKMEKAGVVQQSVIDHSRLSINAKIRKWRKWSFFPIAPIAIAHLIVLIVFLNDRYTSNYYFDGHLVSAEVDVSYSIEYWKILFVAIGSAVMIAMGNFAKGAQIFDPNKQFRGNTGRRWW